MAGEKIGKILAVSMSWFHVKNIWLVSGLVAESSGC